MQRTLAVATLLSVALSCAAAEALEWGPLVDGLRMSVEVVPDSRGDVQVRVTINYVGDKPLLLPFAFAGGDGISRHRLRLFVSTPDGQHSFSLDSPAAALRGRFDPLVIPMLPQASYVLELPAAAWYRGFTNEQQLGILIQRQGQLWAELDCKYMQSTAIPSLPCPLYGSPNPNGIVCWEGKLTSNKLRLPK